MAPLWRRSMTAVKQWVGKNSALTERRYSLFRHDRDKVAHRFLLRDGKSSPVFAPEPKPAGRTTVEINRSLYFEIVGEPASKDAGKIGQRYIRTKAQRGATTAGDNGEAA